MSPKSILKRLFPRLKEFHCPYNVLYFIPIILINLVVYSPSFQDAPRSDHWVYLANTAHETSWPSLALKNYAINRRGAQFGPPGDQLLFRPLLYVLLGTQRWAFQYHFFWWQITGFILHLAVLWQMLNILLLIRKSTCAVWLTMLFSVLYINNEMVTWQHIHGYLVFTALLMAAFREIITFEKLPPSDRPPLKLVFFLTIGALFYEIGVIYALLFAGYFYFLKIQKSPDTVVSLERKQNYHKLSLACLIAPTIFFLLNALDILYHPINLGLREGGIHHPMRFLFFAFIAWGWSWFWWIFGAIFPSEIHLELTQRTALYPHFLLNEHLPINIHLAIGGLTSLVLTGCAIRIAKIRKDKQIKRWVILTMLMAGIFTFVVLAGRMAKQGMSLILAGNAYYAYLFWSIFLVALYALSTQVEIKGAATAKRIKFLTYLFLFTLILTNSLASIRVNLLRGYTPLINQTFTVLNKLGITLEGTGASFALTKALAEELTLPWIVERKDGGLVSTKKSLPELLYPRSYDETNPSYLFTLDRLEPFPKIKIIQNNL